MRYEMWKKERFILLFLVMAVIAGFVGCSGETVVTAEEKKQDEAIPVEVTKVIKGNVSAYFTGTASLEAENEAKVVAKTSGVVEQIFVEEGDKIKKDQVLAQLDDDKLSLDLAEAEARLKQLEKEFNRTQELHQKSIISTEIYDRAKSEFEMQKTKVDLARLMKNYSAIRAPIDGVISGRLVKVGNMVPQNEPCFQIADFDPLLAILYAPEKELKKLQKNQKALLEVDALPNEEFASTILRISPVVDPQTGTFKVTVAVTDPEGKLKPGMFARVRIVHDVHGDTLLLPKDAVLTEGNESVVFLVKN
ncbi:MAG: efflux RND transporter periplasmic adaptor subunit, partial [Desulfobacteraceae bacterium]